MNPHSKARTWRLPLSTLVVNSDPISPISKPVEVIEKFAYDKAVEALKVAQKENEKLLKFKEEMWKLGQAMLPNAISMMIQRELGKFGETNSS